MARSHKTQMLMAVAKTATTIFNEAAVISTEELDKFTNDFSMKVGQDARKTSWVVNGEPVFVTKDLKGAVNFYTSKKSGLHKNNIDLKHAYGISATGSNIVCDDTNYGGEIATLLHRNTSFDIDATA